MSDLTQEFAINCNPSTAAKPPQYAGKGQAKGHVRAMLDDVRSAHLAGKHKKAKHRMSRYLNSYHAKLVATELARRTMKPHRRFSNALVPSIASALGGPGRDNGGGARQLSPHSSDPDDRRIVMDFGPGTGIVSTTSIHTQFGTAYIARSLATRGGSNLKRPASWRSDAGKPVHRTDLIVLEGTMAGITDQKFAVNCNPAKSEKQEADNA